MKILSLKPGHDGHIAYINGENLQFSIEAEKDSCPRYSSITPSVFLRAIEAIDGIPEVIAISGWRKYVDDDMHSVGAGYFGEGLNTIVDRPQNIFGHRVRFFSSSHERSHLLCSYGMSPFPQGQPCYALVWEGHIGSFYHIDSSINITRLGTPLTRPGLKYSYLYRFADPSFADKSGSERPEDAGKLMALVSYGEAGAPDKEERELIEFLLRQSERPRRITDPALFNSRFLNIGVETQAFKNLARKFSEAIFDRMYSFAKDHLRDHLPLIISGGCGLNCDWNSAWRSCDLFDEVFVPPCANDSGSAIGTAVDAMRHCTGRAKVRWTVYAGEEFVMDDADLSDIDVRPLNLLEVAEFLRDGNVIAWVQGRYEIGPRALGNRSILAAPFTKEMHARLNRIKGREGFRPIAPICREEEMDLLFEHDGASPFMLLFQKVKTDALRAITHVDGSARLQSVNATQNPLVHALLCEFGNLTGYGVLCNTSLNFKGCGFINRLTDLVMYARQHELDGFVVADNFYRIRRESLVNRI